MARAQTPTPPDDAAAVQSEFLFRDRRSGMGPVRAPPISRAVLSPSLASEPDALDSLVSRIVVAGAADHLHPLIAAAAEGPDAGVATLSSIVEHAERLLSDDQHAKGPVLIASFDRDRAEPGLIRVSVQQPSFGGVEMVGTPENIRTYLTRLGARLRQEGPLTEERLARYLILFNRIPGCKTRFDLRMGGPMGDEAKLMVHVDYERALAHAEINSRAPRGIGRELVSGKLVVNDVAAGPDFIDLRARTNISPGRAFILDASYGVNLHPDGLLLELTAFSTAIHPARERTGGNELEIANRFFGATLTRPLRLRHRSQAFLSVGASSGETRIAIDGPAVVDDTRWLGSLAAEWTQLALGGVTTGKASINHGFAILGATRRGDPRASRAGDGADFTYFAFEGSREQTLTPWAVMTVDVYAQAATQALFTPDQCVYGGGDYGRAFEINAIFGDSCFLGAAELSLSPKALDFGRIAFEPYAYADGGALRQVGIPDPGQAARVGRMSAGGGLRVALGKSATARMEFTQALRRDTPTGANQERAFYFALGADF